jgi:hypothetical protein
VIVRRPPFQARAGQQLVNGLAASCRTPAIGVENGGRCGRKGRIECVGGRDIWESEDQPAEGHRQHRFALLATQRGMLPNGVCFTKG